MRSARLSPRKERTGATAPNRNQPLYHYSAYSEPAEPEPVSETAARGGMLCQNTIS